MNGAVTPRFKVCDASFHPSRRLSRNYCCIRIFLRPRLRRSREQALELFERAWHLAVRRGVMNEKDAALLYVHCLARTLRLAGVEVSRGIVAQG